MGIKKLLIKKYLDYHRKMLIFFFMTTFSTNDDNFDKDIAESKAPVLVDFWAERSGPCKQIGSI